MAEGFRVTEDGSLRVTESLDPRITQNYAPLYATSALSANGTQISIAGILLGASSDLIGTLSELAANTYTAGAVSLVSGYGTISAEATWFKNFKSDISAQGSITPKLGYLIYISSSLSSGGTIGLLPGITRNVQSSLNSSTSTDLESHLVFDPGSSLQANLSLDVVPTLTASAQFAGSSVGTVTALGTRTVYAVGSLQSHTDFLIYPLLIQAAASLQGGSGTVVARGGFLASGEAALTSNGTLNGNLTMILNAIVTSGDARRITEDGSPRIVSDGNFRASFAGNNLIDTTMVGTPSLTLFNATIYSFKDGQWNPTIPRVKRNGVWVTPTVYVKNNGTWKRVY